MAKKNPEILKPGKPFTTDCLAPWLDRVLVRRDLELGPIREVQRRLSDDRA